jgi:hypothetical protein
MCGKGDVHTGKEPTDKREKDSYVSVGDSRGVE